MPVQQHSSQRAHRSDGLPSSERIYRELRERIISGSLAPGTRVVEVSLATELAVSRTPVREAVKRLQSEQLLAEDPLRGLVVRGPEAGEIEDVYRVREVLDGLATRLAVPRVTEDDLARLEIILDSMREAIRDGQMQHIVSANIAFHDVLYRCAGNLHLTRIGRDLRDYVRRFSLEAFASPERAAAVVQEHERILDALRRRDAEAAEVASRDHLRVARNFVTRLHLRESIRT